MDTSQPHLNPPSLGLQFGDILFAFAVNNGFREGVLSDSHSFFRQWRPPSSTELVDVCVFALGLLVLIESWLGYHSSVARRPVRGWFPLAMDIFMILVCTLMLAQYQHFDRVLLLIVAVFAGYAVWDVVAWLMDRRRPTRDDVTSLVWLAVLLGIALLYVAVPRQFPILGWTAIVTACVALYRIDKATTFFRHLSCRVRYGP